MNSLIFFAKIFHKVMEISEKSSIFTSNLFQLYESMAEDLHNLLHDKLKEYFGFTSFKGYQEAAKYTLIVVSLQHP